MMNNGRGKAVVAVLSCVAPAFLVTPASAQLGKSQEEIVQLAAKEGRVRLGAGLSPADQKIVLKGFSEKYPKIQVEVVQTSGSRWAERVLNEAMGGVYELDLYEVPSGIQSRFTKLGIVQTIDWQKLFPQIPPIHVSPDNRYLAAGFNLRVIAYNPKLVPPEKVLKDWSDCLDPQWKGRLAVDTTPRFLTGLYGSWGEARVLDFAQKLKENRPVFQTGQTAAVTQLAAGEFPVFCGAHYASLHRLMRRDGEAKVAVAMPKEVPLTFGEMFGVMKGAKNPNAAVLLAAWLASPDGGQVGYEQVGRGSPLVPGSEKAVLLEKAGSKLIPEGWDSDREPDVMKKILAALGFPTQK